MENATKALLIAAAILVAILIISLGLVVYNMAAETVQGVNMSEQEIQAHNDKFTRYEGSSQRGSQVNAMLSTVLTNNLDSTDEGEMVKVTLDGADYLTTGRTSSPTKVDTGKTFTVTAVYDATTKLITEMTVTTNTATP